MLRRLVRRSATLSIALVGAGAMAALNRRYRGKDYPTDVLSFPLDESIDGSPLLGEVVISPAVAARNARRFGVAEQEELRKLLVHGILHVLGFDHETDGGEMARLERRLLARPEVAGVRLEARPRAKARTERTR